MKIRFFFPLSSLITLSASSLSFGATPVFFNDFRDNEGSQLGSSTTINSGTHGDPAGANGTIQSLSQSFSGLNFTAGPSPASPAGGNYVALPGSGQGNAYDLSFALEDLTDASGNPVAFVDGETYTASYWMKPALLTVGSDNSEWALIPSSTTITFIGGAFGTGGGSFTVPSWSPYTWSEIQVPFTYTTGLDLTEDTTLNLNTVGFSLVQTNGTGGTAPFALQSYIYGFNVDYGVGVPAVPEPSAGFLSLIGLCGLLRARRR